MKKPIQPRYFVLLVKRGRVTTEIREFSNLSLIRGFISTMKDDVICLKLDEFGLSVVGI